MPLITNKCAIKLKIHEIQYLSSTTDMTSFKKTPTVLPIDVISIDGLYQKIVEHLSPLDLYHLTNSCATLFNTPLLSLDVIVKCALLNGDSSTKTTIENIYHQVIANSIHMPSPHRLLRLLCQKSCEICNRRNSIRYTGHYCISMCFNCTIERTLSCRTIPQRMLKSNVDINELLQDPRILTKIQKLSHETYHKRSPYVTTHYILDIPVVDRLGHPIGPIFTSIDLPRFLALANHQEVDTYIKNRTPQCLETRNAFIHAVAKYRPLYYKHMKDRQTKAQEAQRKAREKKLQNACFVLDCLIESMPLELQPLFTHTIDWQYAFRKLTHPISKSPYEDVCIYMRNPFLRKVLRPMFFAPTRYKRKQNLKPLANAIRSHWGIGGDE